MKKGKGKSIGNSFERKFCKILSQFLTGEKDSLICWRVQSSGAINTMRQKKNLSEKLAGDIDLLPDTESQQYKFYFDKFYFDTKSSRSFELNWLKDTKDYVRREWDKVYSQCPNTKIPICPIEIRDRKTPLMVLLQHDLGFRDYMYHKDSGLYFVLLQDFLDSSLVYCKRDIEKELR